MQRLGGSNLDAVATKVIQLVTVDAAGRPHPSMLSYFEVAATGPRHVRCACRAASATSANLRRSGHATFAIIDERFAYYVKASATELAASMRAAAWNASFDCHVEEVLADAADAAHEPDVYVASGVTYHDPRAAAGREQARAVLAELLE